MNNKVEYLFTAPAAGRPESGSSDSLDRAGQAILNVANKLSTNLQAAENHIRDLEADLRYYQDRTARAEKWLLEISGYLERKFVRDPGVRRGRAGPAQAAPPTYSRED